MLKLDQIQFKDVLKNGYHCIPVDSILCVGRHGRGVEPFREIGCRDVVLVAPVVLRHVLIESKVSDICHTRQIRDFGVIAVLM